MSRALVVDDKESGRRALSAELGDAGFRVEVASDAFDALEKFADVDPSVVVTDFQLPDLDGLVLLERIREFSTVPIIMISAYGSDELSSQAHSRGANRFMNFTELSVVGTTAEALVREWAARSSKSSRSHQSIARNLDRVLKKTRVQKHYLESGGNAAETARRLCQSRGSVRYQLKLLGIDC